MKERIYREYGGLLTVVGLLMLLVHTMIVGYWYSNPIIISRLYNDPRTTIVLGFLPLGIILTCSGVIIRTRFREGNQFLIKDGGLIHSGNPWYEGFESGLFLTSCGLVVSINQESKSTAHVGYRIVSAKRATHTACVVKEGRAVLDMVAKRSGH
ncbi:MAG: hypothetical protein E3J86_10205 [Candidatus Thorarchaeota archaeon]|jgi:O-antigen/teichoic acid export membrane protein|nr:MAG: hypothetical protein E3J86_10190 [Candidatus Thorarchaeota archaeon]TET08692.1 MAG: hypothetical protein E3J86_10205 [Candidatus Thorarchaeota archaeon]